MKNLHATKPRSFRRFVNQLLDHILKHQPQDGLDHFPDELMQQLKRIERKIDAYTRASARQAKQK